MILLLNYFDNYVQVNKCQNCRYQKRYLLTIFEFCIFVLKHFSQILVCYPFNPVNKIILHMPITIQDFALIMNQYL